jgi:hypothetical protein
VYVGVPAEINFTTVPPAVGTGTVRTDTAAGSSYVFCPPTVGTDPSTVKYSFAMPSAATDT